MTQLMKNRASIMNLLNEKSTGQNMQKEGTRTLQTTFSHKSFGFHVGQMLIEKKHKTQHTSELN